MNYKVKTTRPCFYQGRRYKAIPPQPDSVKLENKTRLILLHGIDPNIPTELFFVEPYNCPVSGFVVGIIEHKEDRLSEKQNILQKIKYVDWCGLTNLEKKIYRDKIIVEISHAGNMGNSIKDVEENLQKLSPSLSFKLLKNIDGFYKITEKGYPDYFYIAKFFYKRLK